MAVRQKEPVVTKTEFERAIDDLIEEGVIDGRAVAHNSNLFEITIFRVDELQIDRELYQREPNWLTVQRITEKFNPDLFERPKVNLRDGVPYVVDGQNRVLAARALKWEYVEVEVYRRRMSAEDEAGLYVGFNTARKQLTKLEVFKGRVAEGDPYVCGVKEICDAYGFRIGNFGSNRPKMIQSVVVLERIYRQSPHELSLTLFAVGAIWPDNARATRGQVISGMHRFLTEYEDHRSFDLDSFINKMQRHYPIEQIERSASNLTIGRRGTETFAQAFADALRAAYNSGKKLNRLPEFGYEQHSR